MITVIDFEDELVDDELLDTPKSHPKRPPRPIPAVLPDVDSLEIRS